MYTLYLDIHFHYLLFLLPRFYAHEKFRPSSYNSQYKYTTTSLYYLPTHRNSKYVNASNRGLQIAFIMHKRYSIFPEYFVLYERLSSILFHSFLVYKFIYTHTHQEPILPKICFWIFFYLFFVLGTK